MSRSATEAEGDAVAVTGRDETNLLAAGLAQFAFGVSRTLVRTVDPRHAWVHTPAMGVDIAVDQAQLIASLVAEEIAPRRDDDVAQSCVEGSSS